MANDNRKWIEGWVRSQNERPVDGSRAANLSEAQIQTATDIGVEAFRGRTGVGVAARIGIDSVKKLRR